MHTGFAARTGRAVLMAVAACAVGCSTTVSMLEIVDHRAPGMTRRYREHFEESYYSFDQRGNVEIVLRRSTAGRPDPSAAIQQTVHIRSLWQSIPGQTVAHRTQINATVVYSITRGHISQTFEGAGSVFYKLHGRTGELTGAIELATLRPTSQTSASSSLFKQAELAGTFRATHDPRRVVRIVNEMARRAAQTTAASRRAG